MNVFVLLILIFDTQQIKVGVFKSAEGCLKEANAQIKVFQKAKVEHKVQCIETELWQDHIKQ